MRAFFLASQVVSVYVSVCVGVRDVVGILSLRLLGEAPALQQVYTSIDFPATPLNITRPFQPPFLESLSEQQRL